MASKNGWDNTCQNSVSKNRSKKLKYAKGLKKMTCETLSQSSKGNQIRVNQLQKREKVGKEQEMKKAEVELKNEEHEIKY